MFSPTGGRVRGMSRRNNESLMPWSHRQSPFMQMFITMLAGAASAFVGTIAHRMGAFMNIPYGLVIALLILGISTWCARARMGTTGIGVHLIASSVTAWGVAICGVNGSALTPVGFSGSVPFFSQNVGYIWLYGLVILQVVMLFLPRKWFTIPPRKEYTTAAKRTSRP